MATPIVKMADQMRIDPLRPKRSEVRAWPRAPTNVLQKSLERELDAIGCALTYPADSKDVIMDCLELERVKPPFPSG